MEAPYYIAPEIKEQLDRAKDIVKNADQDRVFIITEAEGSGKSVLAMQLASYVDENFSIKDITFNSEQFAERTRIKEPLGAVIDDEANSGLSSRAVLSKENKKMVRLLQECRQRNLFLFIVLPSVFMLEKYVVLHRSHALFHTYIYRKDFKKRAYKVYNKKNKQLLYILGAKMMSYSKPRVTKSYRFYGKYPPNISEKEYRDKKLASFRDEKKKTNSKEEIYMKQRDALIEGANREHKVKFTEMAKWLEDAKVPLNAQYVSQISKK